MKEIQKTIYYKQKKFFILLAIILTLLLICAIIVFLFKGKDLIDNILVCFYALFTIGSIVYVCVHWYYLKKISRIYRNGESRIGELVKIVPSFRTYKITMKTSIGEISKTNVFVNKKIKYNKVVYLLIDDKVVLIDLLEN